MNSKFSPYFLKKMTFLRAKTRGGGVGESALGATETSDSGIPSPVSPSLGASRREQEAVRSVFSLLHLQNKEMQASNEY